MNRRGFFKILASGLVIATGPTIFIPKIIKPVWKPLVVPRASIGNFDRWIFPIIANMSETDVIDQLVKVQPMSLPTGATFYMDFKYGPPRRRPFLERLFPWLPA
jgi:hypothetical protein